MKTLNPHHSKHRFSPKEVRLENGELIAQVSDKDLAILKF